MGAGYWETTANRKPPRLLKAATELRLAHRRSGGVLASGRLRYPDEQLPLHLAAAIVADPRCFPPADSWDIITADMNPIQPGRRRERHRCCLREEVHRSTRPHRRAGVRHASGARLSHRQAAGEGHGLRRRAGTGDGAPAQVRCPGGKGARRPRDRRRGVFGYPNREIVGGDGRRQYAPSLASTSSPNRGRWGGFVRDGQSSFGRDLPVASIRITPV